MKPLTDDELMERLAFHRIPHKGTFICDVCGSYANRLEDLKHKSWCPDVH